jgi:hypothetical protein
VNPEKAPILSAEFFLCFFAEYRPIIAEASADLAPAENLPTRSRGKTLGLKPQESRYFAKAVKKFHSGGFC